MTHTSTVNMVLDATRRTGILYHSLSPATRSRIQGLGQDYILAHSRGDLVRMERAQSDIIVATRS
jgi:hypothetical protein